MPISQPTPVNGAAVNQIVFGMKSPTNSGARVEISMSVSFPSPEEDPTLTEAQKNAVLQKLVDFFSGLQNVVPPVTGTKTYPVRQQVTAT